IPRILSGGRGPVGGNWCVRARRGSAYRAEVAAEVASSADHHPRGYQGEARRPPRRTQTAPITLAAQRLDQAALLGALAGLREVTEGEKDGRRRRRKREGEPFTKRNPPDENRDKYFYDEPSKKLDEAPAGRVHVKNVTIFKPETTTATYTG